MTTRRARPLARPQLDRLETRDVPATFYVDPTLFGKPDGSTQTFNAGKTNQVTGLKYGNSPSTPGATLFSRFNDATFAAISNSAADTIVLADGNIFVDNTPGAIALGGDNITIQGGGSGVTTLKPVASTAGSQYGVIESVGGGSVINVFDLTFDGFGAQVGNAFYLQTSAGYFRNATIRNVQFGTNLGVGVAATTGSYVNVVSSLVTNYGRIGVDFVDSTGSVSFSTVAGRRLVSGDVVNYGVQITGASNVTVQGSNVNGNQATSAAGDVSAGVWLYQDGGTPTATIVNNTFANNTDGVLVGFELGNDTATAEIHRNDFATSNTYGVVAQNNTTVNATRNFWGSKLGPTDVSGANPNGNGAGVSTQVNYLGWLQKPFAVGEPTVAFAAAPGAGNAAGSPVVQFNRFGGTSQSLSAPFGGTWKGEVRVATGDVTGDGVPDVVLAQGPGGLPRVQVYDGATGALVRDFFAFDQRFNGGVFVAVGDVNGDGYADIIAGAGAGSGPTVSVFDGGNGTQLLTFLAFDPAFNGGVTVAAGDVNNDGRADIVVGAGAGAGPSVKVFTTQTGSGLLSVTQVASFLAFAPDFGGGVFVAAGDVNGDGRADVIVGAGAGAQPRVRVFASKVDGSQGAMVGDFLVPDAATFAGGVRVAARDLDDDGNADLILGLGAGTGSDSKIRTVNATSISLAVPPLGYFAPNGLYAGTPGIYVG